MSKIAIVGAGIFGSTCALRLADLGHKCVLFEKKIQYYLVLPELISIAFIEDTIILEVRKL